MSILADLRLSNSHPISSKVHLNNPLVFRFREYGEIKLWSAYDRFGIGYYVMAQPLKKGFELRISDHLNRPLLMVDHSGYVSRESEQQRLLQEAAEWVASHYIDKGELPEDFSGVIV